MGEGEVDGRGGRRPGLVERAWTLPMAAATRAPVFCCRGYNESNDLVAERARPGADERVFQGLLHSLGYRRESSTISDRHDPSRPCHKHCFTCPPQCQNNHKFHRKDHAIQSPPTPPVAFPVLRIIALAMFRLVNHCKRLRNPAAPTVPAPDRSLY